MKKIITLALGILLLTTSLAFAGWVNGYTRSDGTHVRGHYRSNPNSTRSDNYGRSSANDRRNNVPSSQRDYDGDGIPNVYDYDDDGDGIGDDWE